MYIERICLNNFRNINDLDISLYPGINILYGKNAQGKTNFLESVYFCATGRSHRTISDRDLIAFKHDDAHIRLFLIKPNSCSKLDAHIKREGGKAFLQNGVPVRKLGDLLGQILTVIFSPEDLNLIKAGPSIRRRFLDMELCQLSPLYYHELTQYTTCLKQRNKLLKEIQKWPDLKETLFVWNEQISLHGTKIIKYRKQFIREIGQISNQIHNRLTGDNENLEVIYEPSINCTGVEEYIEKLNKSIQKDIFYALTSYGVHRDDVSFLINGVNTRIYGSQGQQRTASLSLKLSEIEFIKREKNENPVLLLDDVLSELDKSRQNFLLESLKGIQTIITCTGVEDVLKKLGATKDIGVFKVENGIVIGEPYQK